MHIFWKKAVNRCSVRSSSLKPPLASREWGLRPQTSSCYSYLLSSVLCRPVLLLQKINRSNKQQALASSALLLLFFIQTLQFCWWRRKNIFPLCAGYPCYATDHAMSATIRHMDLFWHCQLELIGWRGKSINHATGLTEIVWQRREAAYYFLCSCLLFMPLVPVILMRNEKLSDSLSFHVALSFQWVLGHVGLTGNELAVLLVKNGATLSLKIRHTRYFFWRRNFSHSSLSCQIPLVSSEELALPHLSHCELSQLCCHGHSFLLSSYLCRIKRKKNSSCSACGHSLQDLIHLLLDCPASEHLQHAIIGTTSSIFDLWFRP